MVLYVMLFGLGFLTAVGISAAVAPLVWRQAQIVSRQRALATLPMRMSDIVAGRDQVRAGFIVEMRRLEHDLGEARRRFAEARIEIGRQTEITAALGSRLQQAGVAIASLETQRDRLSAGLAAREEKLAETEAARAALEKDSQAKSEQIARLTTTIADITATSDSRRVEIAALRTKVETLREQIDNLERAKRRTEARLAEYEAQSRAFEAERSGWISQRETGRMNRRDGEGARPPAVAPKESTLETQLVEQTMDAMRLQDITAALRERTESLSGGAPPAPRSDRRRGLSAERLDAESRGLEFEAAQPKAVAAKRGTEANSGDIVPLFEPGSEDGRRAQEALPNGA